MFAKIFFLMVTWPIGLTVITSIILVGFELDLYALVVHEMFFILIFAALMISALIYIFSSTKRDKPVLHTMWYALRVSIGALLNYTCFLMYTIKSATPAQAVGVWIVAIAMFSVVVRGILSAYKSASSYVSSANIQ